MKLQTTTNKQQRYGLPRIWNGIRIDSSAYWIIKRHLRSFSKQRDDRRGRVVLGYRINTNAHVKIHLLMLKPEYKNNERQKLSEKFKIEKTTIEQWEYEGHVGRY